MSYWIYVFTSCVKVNSFIAIDVLFPGLRFCFDIWSDGNVRFYVVRAIAVSVWIITHCLLYIARLVGPGLFLTADSTFTTIQQKLTCSSLLNHVSILLFANANFPFRIQLESITTISWSAVTHMSSDNTAEALSNIL